jgi:hypothetical protein
MTHNGTPTVCKVYIDDEMKRGAVAFHPDFFVRTMVDPTHHVVVSSGENRLRLRTRENDLLKADEVAISPRLAVLLDVVEGDSVSILDRPTLGDDLFDEVEPLVDLLEQRAENLKEFLEEDLEQFRDNTVEEVLDFLIAERRKPREKGYLEVPPSPEKPGPRRKKPSEEEAEKVKIWSPDSDGDGTVPVFDPEEE